MPKTPSYIEVTRQIAALEKQAAALKAREITGVIARIKEAIAAYELTAEDLGLQVEAISSPRRKVNGVAGKAGGRRKLARAPGHRSARSVKYRDGDNVWGGMGPHPRWLREALKAGRSLEEFAV